MRGTKTERSDRLPPDASAAGSAPEGRAESARPRAGPVGQRAADLAVACRKLGVPVVTPNDLRRTFASRGSSGGRVELCRLAAARPQQQHDGGARLWPPGPAHHAGRHGQASRLGTPGRFSADDTRSKIRVSFSEPFRPTHRRVRPVPCTDLCFLPDAQREIIDRIGSRDGN